MAPKVILPVRPNSTSPSIVHSHLPSAEKSKGSVLHQARMLQERHKNQMLTMARQSPILDRPRSSSKGSLSKKGVSRQRKRSSGSSSNGGPEVSSSQVFTSQ